jgi:hypothetical protein
MTHPSLYTFEEFTSLDEGNLMLIQLGFGEPRPPIHRMDTDKILKTSEFPIACRPRKDSLNE